VTGDEDTAGRSFDEELTDGYACALAIEAECVAMMRAIAAGAAATRAGEPSADLQQLALRLGELQGELGALRAELDERRRALDPSGRIY